MFLGNAPQAEYYGAEAELLLNPIEGLEFMFGLSHLNTEFTEFLRPLTGQDLAGNENVYAPEWKFMGLALYEWATPALFDGKMAASFNWSWTDDQFNTIDNTSRSRSKAHWLAGSRLSWLDQGENLEVALWVKNISDTKYRVETFEFSAAGWITSVPNRPRSFGAEVTYRW